MKCIICSKEIGIERKENKTYNKNCCSHKCELIYIKRKRRLNNKKNRNKDIKEIINKDKEAFNLFNQVMLGSCLGDGNITKPKSRKKSKKKIKKHTKYTFYEAHAKNQEDYLIWKKKIFEKIVKIKQYNDYSKVKYGNQIQIHIYSKSTDLLSGYYRIFYPEGKRIIPLKALIKLEKLGLLVWYLDNGSIDKKTKKVTITMYSKYAQMVKNYFKEFWDMDGFIAKKTNTKKSVDLRFNKLSSIKFLDMVKDIEIPECMYYKVNK